MSNGPIVREMVRRHQRATDTNDSKMLTVMTDFIGTKFGVGIMRDLEMFIVEKLERIPGDVGA